VSADRLVLARGPAEAGRSRPGEAASSPTPKQPAPPPAPSPPRAPRVRRADALRAGYCRNPASQTPRRRPRWRVPRRARGALQPSPSRGGTEHPSKQRHHRL